MHYTDLALEAHQQVSREEAALEGVVLQSEQVGDVALTRVQIRTPEAAQKLGKPAGTYVTLELAALLQRAEAVPQQAGEVLGQQLGRLLPEGPVLVAGLGNRAITPDAIGPRSLESLLVTRHLRQQIPELFCQLRDCSAFAPGVLGTTGMESAALVRSALEVSGAAVLIVVDALAACEEKRLCTTVQLSDTGLTPGSGIGNCRAAFDRQTMGVPVIALGVPTVIRADALYPGKRDSGLIVTPSDIDRRVALLARILSAGMNRALYPALSAGEISKLVEPQ